jgi:hypothetical protein
MRACSLSYEDAVDPINPPETDEAIAVHFSIGSFSFKLQNGASTP